MLPPLYVYDLETYRNCFLFSGKFRGKPEIQVFEISSRRNDRDQLLQWSSYLQNSGSLMVGFNSLGFDYPIFHEFLNAPYVFDATKAFNMAQDIIGSQTYGMNPNAIRLNDRLIPQVDLVKVNHFDNANKRTSLKSLQFAMRSQSVEDLPFDFRLDLTSEQMDQLIAYNKHDVTETEIFLEKCIHLIELRQELLDNGVLSGDVLNFNDTKIGTEFLIRKIGRQKCFVSGSTPRQSKRSGIEFKNLILPNVKFKTEKFDEVRQWFEQQTIYVGAKAKPKLEIELASLPFKFGLGGVHASVKNRIFESTKTHVIKDIDVAGMYVAVAIANGFAPEHLGSDFTVAYRQLQSDRAQYKKGTTMNAVLKLAGNGVYGNSNNEYSCFYDPKYTFSVTVNGQLQLLQLVESLSLIPGLEVIQANTDGITAYFPREMESLFKLWTNDWERNTGLVLEEVEYSQMFIRDVNSYVAITTDGKVKRKGAYWYPIEDKDYEGWWNKDFSNMSAQKGAEQVMLTGCKPEEVIKLITNPFDFMLRYKTPAGAKVYIGNKEMLKTVRYYVSTKGEPMRKVAGAKGPVGAFKRKNKITDEFYEQTLREVGAAWDERIHTKNRSIYEAVETRIESGRLIKECNHVKNFNWNDVDYDYYIQEIKKLIVGEK